MNKWTRVMFQPNLPLTDKGYVTASSEHIALSKEAAKEGMVLLKNNNGVLPLKKGCKVALFGKGSFDYVKGGGGSGDVTVSYVRNLYEGLKHLNLIDIYEPLSDFYRENVSGQYAEGVAPGMTIEPAIDDSLVKDARAYCDTAIITISRFSGEGWDRSSIEFCDEYNPWEDESSMPKRAGEIFDGLDFNITNAEKEMIEKVASSFDNIVVVLNTGGVIETKFFKEDDRLDSLLLAWQAGMEGGLAMAELICGITSPSGKLPDTFAESVDDYPSTEGFHESPYYVDYTEDIYVGYRYFETFKEAYDTVCYPFGYGLSYTTFDVKVLDIKLFDDDVKINIKVTNTGTFEGKEVVQVYTSAPQGLLGKPSKELKAFKKTSSLKPGECETFELSFAKVSMASFDDLGKISKSAYVLEKGTYEIYVGTSIRDVEKLDFSITIEDNEIVEQLSSKCAPTSLKKRLLADGSYEELPILPANDPNQCIFEKMERGTEEALAPAIRYRGRSLLHKPYAEGARPFWEVAVGNISLDEFMAQLSDELLIELLGGQPNTGVANTYGFGNIPEYGIPNVMTADGPAGLRIGAHCSVYTTAWPCSTLLASTWNPDILEKIGIAAAEEVKENNLGVWLAPAVNIHRNPLCGRNFEYYSEDPYLTGKMAASMVRGIQSLNIASAVKHFAANNKETNRKHSDSRVSERALREIYLKGFEIIVKEADPWVIMSAYNIVNGHRASESHELLEGILRDEWGFNGMVTSDWWTRGEHYKEILAGNDVKMACGFPERVAKAMEMGAITRKDLEHCARRVLELILKID